QDDTFGKLRPFEIDHYPAPLIINQTYQTSTKSVKLKNFATEPPAVRQSAFREIGQSLRREHSRSAL
ncbi:hypothetical protein ACFQ3K_16725, partial [Brucella gallinifaecis]|uniref:hypothetical protein n=1 Tax=Brucella gallinifaecis TaxID=215590 RepID=UPI003642C27A